MARAVATFLVLLLAHASWAEEVVIRNVGRGHAAGWAFADNGWVRNCDVMEVKFSVEAGMPSGRFKMAWGFFDGDGKLLGKFSGLPRVQTRGSNYQTLPPTLSPGRSYEIAFPVPPSISTGANRWKTFVVALGNGPARAVYPPGRNVDDLPLDAPAGKPAAADVKPAIKRITRYRNGQPAWVDKSWKKGLNTLRVTVQLDTGAEAGGFHARVYFFDATKKRIFGWPDPPQVSVGPGSYVSLPAAWKNGESYDLHFPVPQRIDEGPGQWRTAIVVFGNAGAVTAESYPAAGRVAEFDFPEKARLPAEPPAAASAQ